MTDPLADAAVRYAEDERFRSLVVLIADLVILHGHSLSDIHAALRYAPVRWQWGSEQPGEAAAPA